MSATPKRQPAGGGTPRGQENARPGAASPNASRTPVKQAAPGTPNGVAKTRAVRNTANGSPLSAKASVRKPGSTVATDDAAEEDRRLETAALIDDLKEQLRKTEEASTEYQKQVSDMQFRLDELTKDQLRMEEKSHEDDERIEGLENVKRHITKQQREMDSIYEAERSAWMKEKDEATSREDELHSTIARLKDAISNKETKGLVEERPSISRNSSLNAGSPDLTPDEHGHFAPRQSIQRSNSTNSSKLLLQKDKVIEDLRLQIAEITIRQAELENQGDGRVQALERTILETKVTNARLMEENESFQLLLSEKTLKGDFRADTFEPNGTTQPTDAPKPKSLADELENLAENQEGGAKNETEQSKRLLTEVNSLKDQNRALTLYIEKIIDRLLTHKGLESVLDQTPDLLTGPKPVSSHGDDAAPPPPPKDQAAAPSLLQRAKSVVTRAPEAHPPRPRPTSIMAQPALPPLPTANEDPDTAPSIPLGRSASTRTANKRATIGGYADIVNNMYKNPTIPQGPGSPGLTSPRQSFFGNRQTSGHSVPTIRESFDDDEGGRDMRVNEDALSALSGGPSHTDASVTSSPPRTVERTQVFTGGKMRPLRLVQQDDGAQARKQANRQSWMGWMGSLTKGKGEE